jgi:DNA-directed RNA polymerase specialized sigma24 family protein
VGQVDDAGTPAAWSVPDRRPGLLRIALLLTGHRAPAEELVQRALVRARRGDPETAVLQALLRSTTSRWVRLTHAEQVIDSGTADDAAPDLADALVELPARARAVVVLRWYGDLPDGRIAELLRCPVATVRTDAAAGLDRLRPVLAPSPYERAAPDVGPERRLTEQLTGLATAAGAWRLTSAEAVADVAARRSRARRRTALGVAAALAAVAVALPLSRWAPDADRLVGIVQAEDGEEGGRVPSVASRITPVLAGPARGSLAGDAAFLDAVRSVGWKGLEAPPPAEREVVFAGDTPHGRAALVVGTVHEDFRGMWFTGPPGTPADALVPHLPQMLGRDRPVTLLLGGPGDASLVVVAARGDEIRVSDRLLTGPRGTVGRAYTPVPQQDGVAVAPARTTPLGPALSVRVTRDGRAVYRSAVDWLAEGPDPTRRYPALTPLRPGVVVPDPQVIAAALTDIAVPLGAEPTDLRPQLLWTGAVPLRRGPGTVAVVVAHSPGGALVVTTWVGGGGSALSCGTQTPPGAAEVGALIVARVCELERPGAADPGRWLVFTAAPDTDAAQLLDSRGRVLGPLSLTGGSAVVPLPPGARTVRTLDAAGQPVRDTPIAPPPDARFGDFGRGPYR